MQLNPHQQRAVLANGHCMVLACPGSGKTTVLSERAAHLLSSHEYGSLCAVTFTKDAANSLEKRIIEVVGDQVVKRLIVGTFHGLARRQIIGKYGVDSARVISEGARMNLLRRAWSQHGAPATIDEVNKVIEARKASIISNGQTVMTEEIAAVYNAYNELLRAEGVNDFSDLLLRTVEDMRSGDLPPLPCRWLLVDEAQDMDEVQLAWALCYSTANIDTTLVADDDQSLYSFRYALGYAGLRHFVEKTKAEELTLPVNYRCGTTILSHAARLIGYNQNRADKRIEAGRTFPGKVKIERKEDRAAELGALESSIKDSGSPEKWAVLGRTNKVLDLVETQLSSGLIPYTRTGGKSVWDQKTPSTFLGLLQSICDDSWLGISNALFFSGVTSEVVNRLSTFHGSNPRDRLRSIAEQAHLHFIEPEIVSTLDRFYRLFCEWKGLYENKHHTLVIAAVGRWMEQFLQGDKPAKPDVSFDAGYEPQKLSPRAIFVLQYGSLVRLNKGSILQRIKKIQEIRQPEEGTGVALMTLHSSKGLEFDNVWIYSSVEGVIPIADSPLEEERRLMYVGMTRARINLVISYALEDGHESCFIGEAGLSDTESVLHCA